MKDHWQLIGYAPDSGADLEDDVDLDVDVQVGRNAISVEIIGPDLRHRYNSLTISGFKAEHDFEEVYRTLLDCG